MEDLVTMYIQRCKALEEKISELEAKIEVINNNLKQTL